MIYYVGGIMCLMSFPLVLFELGKWSIRKDLKKNIEALKEMKETSNKEISGMINIHLEELEKLKVFNMFKKIK